MLEKILEEFHEPHFGYMKVSLCIKPIELSNGKLTVENKIKFYFWINVAGICTI